MLLLGISAYHADASAAIVKDGTLLAAAEEERFNRVKHSGGFPYQAVKFCLSQAGASLKDADHIAVAQSPNSHWLSNTVTVQSDQFLVGTDRHDRFLLPAQIRSIPGELKQATGEVCQTTTQFHAVPHHLSHLAGGFLISRFERAALASIDSFADFNSTITGQGNNCQIDSFDVAFFPHSLGIFYTMMTQYLGFLNYGDEGKVMGLSAYGRPRFLGKLQKLIHYDHCKGFKLDLDYFTHHKNGFRTTWHSPEPFTQRLFSPKMVEEFGPARAPEEEISEFHCDMAASLQACLEENALRLLHDLFARSGSTNCVLAGGVALNSVLNTKIPECTPFEEVYTPPAVGDSGTALGAAYYVYNTVLGKARSFELEHSFWGPEFMARECEMALKSCGLVYRRIEKVSRTAAQSIASGNIIGWFQGKMEFGPRALGNRSILADPRSNLVKSRINQSIKLREDFRPFAASILADRMAEICQHPGHSPYMSEVFTLREDKKHLFPAVSHIDGTTRLQTVIQDANPLFWNLINEFDKLTHVPMLLNTSFNQQEPIVCTPEDAIRCYLNSNLDALFLGNFAVQRSETSLEV